MIYIIFAIIILSLLSAWEEGQQLIQRGSWKREDYKFPIWETAWDGKWKLFDSHHLAFGLFVLVMFSAMSLVKIDWWMIVPYWIVFFYFRNIFLHIVFKRKPLWKYIYLIIG